MPAIFTSMYMTDTRLACLCLVSLGLFACDNRDTSTNSQTPKTADLYRPDGKPAVGARVQVYSSSDTGTLPAAQVFVGSDGKISLPALAPGWYNIVARDDSGRAMFQDSLVSTNGVLAFQADTLKPVGSVRGQVRVQSQDDPRIAWVHLLGTGIYANVDDSGYFSLAGVPAGTHLIEAVASRGDYSPTFVRTCAVADSNVNLGAIDLVYFGLSTVGGLAATYDSATAVLTVRWNRSKSHGVAGYWVTSGDTSFLVTDTFWTPPPKFAASVDPASNSSTYFDTTIQNLAIQVQAQDSSGARGPKWSIASTSLRSGYLRQRGAWTWTRASALPSGGALAGSILDTLPTGLVLLIPSAERRLGGVQRDTSTWTVWTSADGTSWTGGWKTRMVLSAPVVWGGKIWIVSGGADSSVDATSLGPTYGHLVIQSLSPSGQILSIDTVAPDSSCYGGFLVPHRDTLGLVPYRYPGQYQTQCVSRSYLEEIGIQVFVHASDGWHAAPDVPGASSGAIHQSDRFQTASGSADWSYAPAGTCGATYYITSTAPTSSVTGYKIQFPGSSGQVIFTDRLVSGPFIGWVTTWTLAQPLAWRDGIVNPVAGGRIERWMASDPNRPWSTKPPFVPAVDWAKMAAWKGDLAVISDDGALWLGTLDGER